MKTEIKINESKGKYIVKIDNNYMAEGDLQTIIDYIIEQLKVKYEKA